MDTTTKVGIHPRDRSGVMQGVRCQEYDIFAIIDWPAIFAWVVLLERRMTFQCYESTSKGVGSTLYKCDIFQFMFDNIAATGLKTKKVLARIVKVQLWVISRDLRVPCADCVAKSMQFSRQKSQHEQRHEVVASML